MRWLRENASNCEASLAPRRDASSALSARRCDALVARDACTNHVEVADDRGQQIVEVVRDATGELADRLHLLRLSQRILGTASLGHVAQDERHEHGAEQQASEARQSRDDEGPGRRVRRSARTRRRGAPTSPRPRRGMECRVVLQSLVRRAAIETARVFADGFAHETRRRRTQATRRSRRVRATKRPSRSTIPAIEPRLREGQQDVLEDSRFDGCGERRIPRGHRG